jgi:formylglycine-generating enzyme required for sulfatase activity/predicted nucleic acid-binding Zn ribbon protein
MDLNGIESGDEFKKVIITAINRHTVVLFMLSENSQQSPWALKELNFAEKKNKKVVLVNIDGCEMTDDFAFDFSDHDIIDFDNALQHDKLIRDLRDWLDIPEDDGLQEVRDRVEELKADYNLLVLQQETIDKEIREKQKLLGETENECPVCGKPNEVEAQYCQRCGYILNYFAPRSFEDKRLRLLRLNWASNREAGTIRSQLASVKNQLAIAETETERLQNELKAKEDLLQSKDDEIQSISQRLDDEMKQSSDIKHNLESQLKKSQSEYAALKRQYDEDKKYIEEVKKKEKEEEAKRLAKEEEKRKGFRLFTVNGVTFKMIRVEGGTFQMGATNEQGSDAYDSEKPAHSVTLDDYMIGETKVTQELWEAVMGSNPSAFKGINNPVEQVSWNDCKNFISKLNSLTGQHFRLPTEAEWEFAARGGNKSQHFKYSGSNSIDRVAWYDRNSDGETHPVGKKDANELGLYDMSGNVWEWCSDWYGGYSSSPQTNPKGPNDGSYRVNRGGSWLFNAGNCRVSYRCYYSPDYRFNYLGFRLAL